MYDELVVDKNNDKHGSKVVQYKQVRFLLK